MSSSVDAPLAHAPDGRDEGHVPPEVLAAIRQIAIRARRLVDQSFSGAYRSVFRGAGVEFAGLREYVAGDDVRAIEWMVTAFMDRPFVKIFKERRELNVVLAADLSRSSLFGSGDRLRREITAEICGVLGLAAATNKDRVGLMLFTDEVEHYVRPGRGRNHVMRLIRDLLVRPARRPGTDLDAALTYLGAVLRRRSTVFLVSDFWGGVDPVKLRSLTRRHDCVAVRVRDPRENELPDAGLVAWRDAENDATALVDTSDRRVRAAYRESRLRADAALEEVLNSSGVDLVDVDMEEGYVDPLIEFFKQRSRRRGRSR